MTAVECLEKIGGVIDSSYFGLSTVFVGKVYELLEGEEEFSFSISPNKASYETLEPDLFEGDVSSFNNPYCGADKGACGFNIAMEMSYFASVNDWSSIYHYSIMERMASDFLLFNTGEEAYRFMEQFKERCYKLEGMEEKMKDMLFKEGGLWDIFSELFSWHCNHVLNSDQLTDKLKADIMGCIVEGLLDEDYAEGFDRQVVCDVRNEAVDKWFRYVRENRVCKKDAVAVKDAVSELIKSCMSSYSGYSTELCVDASLDEMEKGKHQFQMLTYQMGDAPYNGYLLADPFQSGLLDRDYLVNMLKVKQLLEEMEGKYHFLSVSG